MEEADLMHERGLGLRLAHRPALIAAYDHEIERPAEVTRRAPPVPERREGGGSGAAVVALEDVAFEEALTSTASDAKAKAAAKASAASSSGIPKKRARASKPAGGAKRAAAMPDPDGLTPIQEVKRPKTMVDHTYRDFSRVRPSETTKAQGVGRLGVLEEAIRIEKGQKEEEIASFPTKLHEVLTRSEEYGEFMAWRPHGRAFALLKPKAMETKVLGKFFGHGRYSTLRRQLNEYGFKQITQGPDRNCFYHEAFLRGLPHLLRFMPPPKTNRRRLASDPDNEPDLFRISELFPLPPSGNELLDDDRKISAATLGGGGGIAAPSAATSFGGGGTGADRPESPASRAERNNAELCMARAAAAASQAAANSRAQRRLAQQAVAQQVAQQRAVAAAAEAEALRRGREAVAVAAAEALVAARRRQCQLDLARSILLGSAAAGGLGGSLPLPTAASAGATLTSALGSPDAADGATATATEALLSALAANTATTNGILGAAGTTAATLGHHGISSLTALSGPAAAGPAAAGAAGGTTLDPALAVAAFRLQQQQRNGVAGAAFYGGYP